MVAAQQEILIVELEPEVNSVCADNALEIARHDICTNVSNSLQEETGSTLDVLCCFVLIVVCLTVLASFFIPH